MKNVGTSKKQLVWNKFSQVFIKPTCVHLRPTMMQGLNDMDGAMQYMTAPGTSNGQGNNVEPSNGKPGKPNKDPRNGGNPPKPKEKKGKGNETAGSREDTGMFCEAY